MHTFQHDLDKSEMPRAFMEQFVWGQNRFPNLFLNFGGQISNGDAPQQRAQLLNLAGIMTKQDRLLVINAYHQEEEVVTIPSADYDEFYDLYGGWLVELLGITEDVFTYTTDYNEKHRRRSVALKLKKDVKISFDWLGRTISFKEGDKITFWRHRREDLPSVQENAENTGMMVELFATTIQDNVACYMLKKR